ncbi:MAG: flagellar biosynthesis repressor FlbT [Thalassobaculales bacterium]
MQENLVRISVTPGERVVINGAVVMLGEDGKSLYVAEDAQYLTADNMIRQEDATTPAKKIYFYLQLMFMDPENYEQHYVPLMDRMIDLLQATTLQAVRDNLMVILRLVQQRQFYDAIEACQQLVIFEQEVLRQFQGSAG